MQALLSWSLFTTACLVPRLQTEEIPHIEFHIYSNILNKHSRKADKGQFSSLGVDVDVASPRLKKIQLVTKCYTGPQTLRGSLE